MAESLHGALLSVLDRTGREIKRERIEMGAGAVPIAIEASREHGRAVIVSLTADVPPKLHVMDYVEGWYEGTMLHELMGRASQ